MHVEWHKLHPWRDAPPEKVGSFHDRHEKIPQKRMQCNVIRPILSIQVCLSESTITSHISQHQKYLLVAIFGGVNQRPFRSLLNGTRLKHVVRHATSGIAPPCWDRGVLCCAAGSLGEDSPGSVSIG